MDPPSGLVAAEGEDDLFSEPFATIAGIYRYPVKGLSPERLDAVELEAGAYVPGDRLFAIENGPSGFDPAAPVFQPKIKFLMLMRNERLAALQTRYEAETGILVIRHEGEEGVRADLRTPEGRLEVEEFFQRFMRYQLRGAPHLLESPSPDFRFVDTPRGFVSLVNLASCRALGEEIGMPVDPLRFRANLYLQGLEPWEEFDLIGHTISVGNGVKLRVTERIDRCAATNVDPSTGRRDMDIPGTLMRTFGNVDCGVFAEVVSGGVISERDPVRFAG
ncbi:MOSC domain-containing protein [Ancylobacter sp. 6x-1]|uniref:MOSC domain-containing protein n=1 Tax=Ancylobacter crimeensis TaxID=2579147 RepID=A0ABT0DEN2_9HYPH|nr:MOSC N-terminal beta barrel domain-containing protein [Ancylobacter crimeensis]MCK0198416.1 MOSC domain-containing protein [Ancylobacter crimeensis]